MHASHIRQIIRVLNTKEETREEAKGAGAGFPCSCKANSDTRDAHHT